MALGTATARTYGEDAIAVGLLEGGKVPKPVKKGELLTSCNAAPDPTTKLCALRRRQDQMLNGGA